MLTDTLGWRSVFGFALLAGGAITLTAYFAMHETHPVAKRNNSGDSVTRSYGLLFRRLRFNAFVFQSGFNTGAFMVMATASATLMTELLHRPATEFGLYFLLFPNTLVSLHPDYVMLHTLRPLSPDRTEVVCEWLFEPETVAAPGTPATFVLARGGGYTLDRSWVSIDADDFEEAAAAGLAAVRAGDVETPRA